MHMVYLLGIVSSQRLNLAMKKNDLLRESAFVAEGFHFPFMGTNLVVGKDNVTTLLVSFVVCRSTPTLL